MSVFTRVFRTYHPTRRLPAITLLDYIADSDPQPFFRRHCNAPVSKLAKAICNKYKSRLVPARQSPIHFDTRLLNLFSFQDLHKTIF